MDGLIALALAKKYTAEHGGGGILVVTISGNEDDGWVADKTFDEIQSAFPCVVTMVKSGDTYFVCSAADCATDEYYAFSNTEFGAGESFQSRYVIKADNTIEYIEYEFPNGE